MRKVHWCFLISTILILLTGVPDPTCVAAEEVGSSESPSTHDSALAYNPSLPPALERGTPEYERALFQRLTDLPFEVGELLTFSVQYGPISAGTATMEVQAMTELDGFDCLHLISQAKSNSFFSVFFRVEDRVESFMDVLNLSTVRFEKHLREGNYESDELVEYDHERLIATYEGGEQVELVPGARDVLAAFYYVRTLDLRVGDVISVPNHADGKNYPLEVHILRKERIETPAGVFNCLVVEPMLKATGLFKQKGKLTVWLTDDDRKIPVLMSSKVMIGSIKAILQEISGDETS